MVALSMDPYRGLAALAYAQERGVEHPVSYAIKVFDNPEWQPRGEKKTPIVNAAVEVTCSTCNGDRFVFVTNDPMTPYGETVKPCPSCNASVNAGFWRFNGERFMVAK
jgi:hypothetical protein